ncbi:MAG TPA: hypothetical protein VKW78_16720 [Terriglobales bacterium]|nr:hypothetical protein [Terriglobales bacterium]
MKKNKDSKKTAKPTHADAELLLKLYELRRDSELRRARQFMAFEYWPQNADDIVAIINEFGTDRNRWYRQAMSYWDMAASMVVHGVLNRELFLDSAGELFFIFAKIAPHLKDVRERTGLPRSFWNFEQLIESSPVAKERFAAIQKRVAMRAKQANAAKA